MPAYYLATMMASRDIKWRPKFTSGLTDDGPDDKRLIIEFSGDIKNIPWITIASYGYAININILVNDVPILFDKNWLRGKGLRKANITKGSENTFVIDIQM